MNKITLGTVAGPVFAADSDRTSIAIQHIGTATPTSRAWVGTDAAIEIGGGFLLAGLGHTIVISREHGADLAWYAIAEADNVFVQASDGGYR